ncbi:MAG: heavy-metal-associated domain-containing protein [Cyclobacteriaceae bacterium]|nr:heavy-metal-associated domain-containing protein [Cyclobacteriaceae bacterium]
MKHTYSLTGMTCSGCVVSVKSKLLMHPDVLSAEVTLDPQQAVIEMSRHVSTDELQKTIGNPKYTISENPASHDTHMGSESTNWFATYRPILLIFGFITGVSAIVSYDQGAVHTMHFMSVFMAGFFLVFSFFKFLDLSGFASSYAMYDILARKIPAYGFVYPFLELALGIAYLTHFNPVITNWATLIIMGLSSIGVIESVLNKKKIRCACLGAVFNLPMSTVTIIEDLLMVVMAALMLLTPAH